MGTLGRYSLILFIWLLAGSALAQNQRMTSLFISNGLTNSGPTRLTSHLTTTAGMTNFFSLDPGTFPYTNRAPYFGGGGAIGAGGDTIVEFDWMGHIIRTIRHGQGAVENIIYHGGDAFEAQKFYVNGPDGFTNGHPNGHIIFAHTSFGNETVGVRYYPQETDADFVNNTYTIELFTESMVSSGYFGRATNDLYAGLPGIIVGGPHYALMLEGRPGIVMKSNVIFLADQTMITAANGIDHGVFVISNTVADITGVTPLLRLYFNDGNDADGYYISAVGDVDGSPSIDFQVTQQSFVVGGNLVTDLNATTRVNSTLVHNGADQFKILTNAYNGMNVFLNLATNTMQFLLVTNNFTLIPTNQNVGQRISFTMYNPTLTNVTITHTAGIQIYGSGVSNVVVAAKRLKSAWESQDAAVTNIRAAFAQQKN